MINRVSVPVSTEQLALISTVLEPYAHGELSVGKHVHQRVLNRLRARELARNTQAMYDVITGYERQGYEIISSDIDLGFSKTTQKFLIEAVAHAVAVNQGQESASDLYDLSRALQAGALESTAN